MKLVIMRHGEAVAAAAQDSARALTEWGRQQAGQAAKVLQSKDIHPALVWASPYLRAQQTATEVLNVFSGVRAETVQELTPDHEPEDILEKPGLFSADEVLLVSHQPLVSRLVFELTDRNVRLDTANAACIEIPEIGNDLRIKGDLLWVI